MKSTNTEKKVLSLEVDLAELAGMLTLYHMCKEIALIYPPGAEIMLYTDEPFLCDMSAIVERHLGETLYQKNELECYQRQIHKLVRFFYPIIQIGKIKNLQELYAKGKQEIPASRTDTDINDMKRFMAQELSFKRFVQAAQKVLFKELAIKACPQFAQLSFREFSDHCSADKSLKKLYADISSQLHCKELLSATARNLAECYAHGATCLRTLLNEQVPGYASAIRLSVRQSTDIGIKLGINLILGSRGTPWHNVLVLSSNGASLENKENARGDFKVFTAGGLKLGYIQQGT